MNLLAFELVVIFVLILINGFLSMSEMALVSSKKTRLLDLARKNSSGARVALKLLDKSSEFLASVQVGITLVGVLTGAFSGATISEKISQYIDNHYPDLGNYSEIIGVGVVVVLVSYLSLVLGELVPKKLALNSPELTASRTAKVIGLVSTLTRPLVWLLARSTELVLRIMGFKESNSPDVTEEEVKIMIEQGTEAGVFERAEETMLKKVMGFSDLRAQDVMTPRTKVIGIALKQPLEKIFETVRLTKHTYYPVYRDNLDNSSYLLSGKLLLEQVLTHGLEKLNLEHCLIKDPIFVPGSLPADEVLGRFKSSQKHIAIVIDEFGGLAGIITLIDLMEAIVGNMPDDMRSQRNAPAVQREDGSWLMDGMLPIHEVAEITGLGIFEGRQTGEVFTIAGFLMQELGKVPKEGDILALKGFRLEIMDMDGNRIDKVLIQKK